MAGKIISLTILLFLFVSCVFNTSNIDFTSDIDYSKPAFCGYVDFNYIYPSNLKWGYAPDAMTSNVSYIILANVNEPQKEMEFQLAEGNYFYIQIPEGEYIVLRIEAIVDFQNNIYKDQYIFKDKVTFTLNKNEFLYIGSVRLLRNSLYEIIDNILPVYNKIILAERQGKAENQDKKNAKGTIFNILKIAKRLIKDGTYKYKPKSRTGF